MHYLILLLFILIAISAIGYIGYNVGLLIGRGMAETAVMKYCQENPWNSTKKLMYDLYRDRMNLTVDPQNTKNHEEA